MLDPGSGASGLFLFILFLSILEIVARPSLHQPHWRIFFCFLVVPRNDLRRQATGRKGGELLSTRAPLSGAASCGLLASRQGAKCEHRPFYGVGSLLLPALPLPPLFCRVWHFYFAGVSGIVAFQKNDCIHTHTTCIDQSVLFITLGIPAVLLPFCLARCR